MRHDHEFVALGRVRPTLGIVQSHAIARSAVNDFDANQAVVDQTGL
jgi:hypothetical protein